MPTLPNAQSNNGRSGIKRMLYLNDVEYDAEEELFIKAIEKYQKDSGKKFPSFCEILQVAKSLGYRKVATV